MESNSEEIPWSQKTHSGKFRPWVQKIKDAHKDRTYNNINPIITV